MQAILQAPDQPEPYLVLSDWLQSIGDPQGTLIALQTKTSQTQPLPPEVSTYLQTHRADLLGPAERFDLQLKWQRGFIYRAELRALADPQDALKALLKQNVARLLKELSLEDLPASTWAGCIAQLREVPRQLEHLTLKQTGTRFDQVLQEVLRSPCLPQLKRLELLDGRVTQKSMRLLLSHRKRLQRLEQLTLRPLKSNMVDLGPLQDIADNVVIG